jgi:MFS family permease
MSQTSRRGVPQQPAVLEAASSGPRTTDVQRPVRLSFMASYALAYIGTILLFLAPLLVGLSLKVNALVGTDRAPTSLSLVVGTGSLLAMFANPFVGQLSDRTTSRLGMRRPWMVAGVLGGSAGMLVVALAPTVGVVLLGWCVAQVFFNALLAALVAVLPDQVPPAQRGRVAGVLGICLPVASVSGTYVVQLFTGSTLAMFLAPCGIGGVLVLFFVARLDDRRLRPVDRAPWSLHQLAHCFYVNPWKNPDFGWAFTSRFLFVLAYAFLTTYQAYYLLERVGTTEHDVAHQVFVGTLAMSGAVVLASLVGGWVSDRTGRRKVFVCGASVVFGLAMVAIASTSAFDGFVVGMAIGGLGFGLYMAVDLALVIDVLPDPASAAKDLGVMNIAGALPSSVAPALAPLILASSGGSYGVLYAVAGACAVIGAGAVLRVKRAR